MGFKLFLKLMLLVVVLALAGPFFINGPDGEPLLTLADVKRTVSRTVADLKNSARDVRNDVARAAGDDNAGKVEVQRWQDENGQWHYSNEAPDDPDVETLFVDPDVNRMDPVEIKRRRATSSNGPAGLEVPGLLTPGKARDVIEDAGAARNELEARNEALKERLDNIE
ncbi:MAG: hypothetical protein AB8G17_14555 [Gammaproteobacteria bacterium]